MLVEEFGFGDDVIVFMLVGVYFWSCGKLRCFLFGLLFGVLDRLLLLVCSRLLLLCGLFRAGFDVVLFCKHFFVDLTVAELLGFWFGVEVVD